MNPTENKEFDATIKGQDGPTGASSEDVEEITGTDGNSEPVEKKEKRSLLSLILTIPVLFCVGFAALLTFSLRWAFSFWADLTMDEIVYHLTSPLEGTGEDIMMKFYMFALLPALAVLALVCVIIVLIRKRRKNWYWRALAVIFVLALSVTGLSAGYAWNTLRIDKYLENQEVTSSFIEDHYVDPNSVTLTFPKTKRNLIFIFLESFETTFTDKKNGGGFEFNCIPEMAKLAQENEDFSGSSKKLNGGHVLPGTTFTMGGMFGQSCGLPLQVGFKAQVLDKHGAMNEMYTQEHFFPGITTLGDILETQGYNNVLFIGSEAVFGGRKLFYSEHGNYEIDDFGYAVRRNWLEQKENSWGYGDWRLFLQAKERLKELSAEDKPFNFTMLTLDTHFEDGIRCKYCEYEYPDNSYADVFACSSRQLSEFISWCQDQEWYENTTIILSGDHTTMDSDFCKDVDKEYPRRTFTCYINADVEPEDPSRERIYTTMDNFPTTLAAMGVTIEGDRLGLGTNLFSSQDTLYETYGDELDAELSRRSLFMEQASEFDPNTQAYKNAVIMYKARYGDDSSVDDSVTDDSSISEKDASAATQSSTSDADTSDTDAGSTSDADISDTDASSPSDTDASSASGADSSGTDDSSISGTDTSGTDESSVKGADGSVSGEGGPAAAAIPEEGNTADVPNNSPFPNDTADLKEHLRGRGVAGSELIKDVMKDPWKAVNANLFPAEPEETVGSGEDVLVVDESIQSDENLAGTSTVISVKNTDESKEDKETVDSDRAPSITELMAARKAQELDSAEDSQAAEEERDESLSSEASDQSESQTAGQPQDVSTSSEQADIKDSSEAEETQDTRSASQLGGEEKNTEAELTQDANLAENTTSENDSSVTAEAADSNMEEEAEETAPEGSWIHSERISDNPLEIGPAARQMYPTMFRDPDYGFLPESKLRIDPYAGFSGNRQPKTKARITTESVKQLKDWISQWNSDAARN